MKMQPGDWFVIALAVLDFAAAADYVRTKRWWEAVLWGCYGVATLALIGLSFQARRVATVADKPPQQKVMVLNNMTDEQIAAAVGRELARHPPHTSPVV